MRKPMKPTLAECMIVASGTEELVKEFDRLTGSNLSRKGSGLDLMIDDASGRTEESAKMFVDFVRECICEML